MDLRTGDELPMIPRTCTCGRAFWPQPGDGGYCGICELPEIGGTDVYDAPDNVS
ncbi:hypothetical protein [Nonomuraea sp. NPDC049480]|uniref:hypothetical protein n=1 Tax=Nonomuraea sp. NPDC049480 TaxID=3364353 RepID=UPI00378F7CDB